jgi:predicted DNA binding protein
MSETGPFLITSKTTLAELQELCMSTGLSPFLCEVDSEMKKEDLSELMKKFRNEDFYPQLLSLMILHPSTDDEILEIILKDTDDVDVLNTIATSRKTSEKILRMLTSSASKSVREHAALGLIQYELQIATPDKFWKIIADYSGEKGIDIGVRVSVVNHPRTPLEVIRKLVEDDVDIVSNLAKERIQEMLSKGT